MNGSPREKNGTQFRPEIVAGVVGGLATLAYAGIKVGEWINQWWNSPGGITLRGLAAIEMANAMHAGEQILNNIGIR